jgi:hypothetical protein
MWVKLRPLHTPTFHIHSVPRPPCSPLDFGARCSRVAPAAKARSRAGNLPASERALRRRPGRARPPGVPCVQVAHKSFNPGGQAPGASDFFSSLSWPAGHGSAGQVPVISLCRPGTPGQPPGRPTCSLSVGPEPAEARLASYQPPDNTPAAEPFHVILRGSVPRPPRSPLDFGAWFRGPSLLRRTSRGFAVLRFAAHRSSPATFFVQAPARHSYRRSLQRGTHAAVGGWNVGTSPNQPGLRGASLRCAPLIPSHGLRSGQHVPLH